MRMYWTDPTRLELHYGVALEGWPNNIPRQRPSELSATDQRRLLDCLNDHTISFRSVDDHDNAMPAIPGERTCSIVTSMLNILIY